MLCLLTAGALAVSASACSDWLPTQSRLAAPDANHESAATRTETGCARFEVGIADGAAHVTSVPAPGCGGAQPVAAGPAEYDAAENTVRIPVRLENRTTGTIQSPIRLMGWQDSLTVVAPAHMAAWPSTQTLWVQAPDSTFSWEEAGRWRRGFAWRLDAVGDAGTPLLLAPGESSPTRWVVIRTNPGVQRFQVTLHARALVRLAVVPMLPPDTVPAWVYSPENERTDPTVIAGRFAGNVITVMFHHAATAEQRANAIALVGGTVIGGSVFSTGNGLYYVQIPGGDKAGPLLRAIRTLEALSYVLGADFEFTDGGIGPLGLKPTDGAQFRDWRRSPLFADQGNWGPEAIGAPAAWGCSVGDSARLAILDHDFHSVTDLTAQTPTGLPSFDLMNQAVDTTDHGTSVASIAAARGDNSQDMTGIAWRNVDLRLYDVAADDTAHVPRDSLRRPNLGYRLAQHLSRAGTDSAQVINISLGLDWEKILGRGGRPSHSDTAHTNRVTRSRTAIRRTLTDLQNLGHRPLIVIAAGNNNLDAYWSGLPNVRDDFPDRVLVVGAADDNTNGSQVFPRASFSNHGALVEIYAPGEGVRGLGAGGRLKTISGTSFAAPHVSGVAALLFAFDRRLSADSVKRLILRGARRGGYLTTGVPVLNAYEALKAAAERSGAPLCGSPVYADTLGNTYVLRDSAWTVSELLFTRKTDSIAPLHGGKRIRHHDGNGYVWRLEPSGVANWFSESSIVDSLDNAANRSRRGQSHHADTTVTIVLNPAASTQYRNTYDIVLNGTVLTSIQGDSINKKPAARTCVAVDSNWDCISYLNTWLGRWNDRASVSFSPNGDSIVVAISRDSSSYWIGSWYPCGGGDRCAEHGMRTGSMDSKLTFISIARPSGRRTLHDPSHAVEGLSLSDDGSRMVTRRTTIMTSSSNTAAGSTFLSARTCDAVFWTAQPSPAVRAWTPRATLPTLNIAPARCYREVTFAA